jgi:hypothetical protein
MMMDQAGLQGQYRSVCADEFPDEWKRDREKLRELIGNLTRIYKHRIKIRIIDAQSPMGLWKKIRHRFSAMPAFIVDKSYVCGGWDGQRLESLIDHRIRDTCIQMDQATRARWPECS